MGGTPHSRASGNRSVDTPTVFTDGACSGNPGPGGWAWVQVDGRWASGYEAATTNQRMELCAVLDACSTFDGPLRIVSDSTYVVNCWRDGWWKGWLQRGWKNSKKEPVANRDLWEQLVPHFRDRDYLELSWVKGHSGDHWNDIADRLAVAAVQRGGGDSGAGPPTEADLAEPDVPGRRTAAAAGTAGPAVPAGSVEEPATPGPEQGPPGPVSRSAARRAADPRVPDGHLLVAAGLRGEALAADATTRRALAAVLDAQRQLHPALVVLSGLRSGAEELAAAVAVDAGLPLAVVLPYPDPARGWPEAERAAFERSLAAAREVVVLERARPDDLAGRRAALSRRDGWLRSCADAAVVVTDGRDPEAEDALRRWEAALGDEVWRLDVP
jgi:ribonuclease HI